MTYRQEKPYSCASSAIRNVIESLNGIVPSEKYVRRICQTTIQGTNEKGIIRGLTKLGYSAEIFETSNEVTFKNRLKKILTQGKKAIVIIQENSHWIAVTGYSNKRIVFADSDFKKVEQRFTLNEFTMICRNIDKINKKTCYFMIVISEKIS
jgi:ABC-type bacteriocin/lantibiotic exporter with double-glycine peptidase domain